MDLSWKKLKEQGKDSCSDGKRPGRVPELDLLDGLMGGGSGRVSQYVRFWHGKKVHQGSIVSILGCIVIKIGLGASTVCVLATG